MTYTVQFDYDTDLQKIEASNLAEVCNKVRHKANHIRIWSPANLLLIDTRLGDSYNLIRKQRVKK